MKPVQYPLHMQVQVLYFGVLKDVLQRDREQIDLAASASVEKLLSQIRGTRLGRDLPWNSLAVAVNQVYAQRDHILRDGDEVALLPPVTGGSQASERAA
jgi:molybdopterin converting factor subunit 1